MSWIPSKLAELGVADVDSPQEHLRRWQDSLGPRGCELSRCLARGEAGPSLLPCALNAAAGVALTWPGQGEGFLGRSDARIQKQNKIQEQAAQLHLTTGPPPGIIDEYWTAWHEHLYYRSRDSLKQAKARRRNQANLDLATEQLRELRDSDPELFEQQRLAIETVWRSSVGGLHSKELVKDFFQERLFAETLGRMGLRASMGRPAQVAPDLATWCLDQARLDPAHTFLVLKHIKPDLLWVPLGKTWHGSNLPPWLNEARQEVSNKRRMFAPSSGHSGSAVLLAFEQFSWTSHRLPAEETSSGAHPQI